MAESVGVLAAVALAVMCGIGCLPQLLSHSCDRASQTEASGNPRAKLTTAWDRGVPDGTTRLEGVGVSLELRPDGRTKPHGRTKNSGTRGRDPAFAKASGDEL